MDLRPTCWLEVRLIGLRRMAFAVWRVVVPVPASGASEGFECMEVPVGGGDPAVSESVHHCLEVGSVGEEP